eukprot:TRINITY_DN81364_c0_g1_i2.p1 TRINITY_DN81364_c0_g1~~TRINITY_DN81364_c0_g1_i2.p1  ORF type:complete len:674 (-),score=124.69 TRINITY_DN81364_c0_g1_i2:8-1732(-)
MRVWLQALRLAAAEDVDLKLLFHYTDAETFCMVAKAPVLTLQLWSMLQSQQTDPGSPVNSKAAAQPGCDGSAAALRVSSLAFGAGVVATTREPSELAGPTGPFGLTHCLPLLVSPEMCFPDCSRSERPGMADLWTIRSGMKEADAVTHAADAQERRARCDALACEAEYGPDHPATVSKMSYLAYIMDTRGRFGEAAAHYRQALRGCRSALSPKPTKTFKELPGSVLVLAPAVKTDESVSPVPKIVKARETPFCSPLPARSLTWEESEDEDWIKEGRPDGQAILPRLRTRVEKLQVASPGTHKANSKKDSSPSDPSRRKTLRKDAWSATPGHEGPRVLRPPSSRGSLGRTRRAPAKNGVSWSSPAEVVTLAVLAGDDSSCSDGAGSTGTCSRAVSPTGSPLQSRARWSREERSHEAGACSGEESVEESRAELADLLLDLFDKGQLSICTNDGTHLVSLRPPEQPPRALLQGPGDTADSAAALGAVLRACSNHRLAQPTPSPRRVDSQASQELEIDKALILRDTEGGDGHDAKSADASFSGSSQGRLHSCWSAACCCLLPCGVPASSTGAVRQRKT